jgi:putative ABC transport system permease protein
MYKLAQDLRFAFRQLYKTPGFTLMVVATLALGIGATTAIFSLVEGVLLRPLPFSDANRLVLLGDHLGGAKSIGVTAREVGTYSDAARAFSSMGAYIGSTYELSGGANPDVVQAARLNAGVFPTLGVEPMLGRLFTAQQENGHEPLAVISYPLWLNRYHRDPQVVGQTIVLDRKSYTIIAVMPRGFEFPLQAGHLDQVQVWVPLGLTADELSEENAGSWGYHMVARLKDGVTIAQASQDADRVAQQVMRNFPPHMVAIRIRGDVTPLLETAVAAVRPLLRTLFLAVAIVLLIACVNVAGLLLVRAIRRGREHAIRLALGAPSVAILRESVCEGVLLSLAGGLLGMGLAAATIRVALRLLPESMPRIESISMDGAVVAFALVLAVATGVLCSLAPAFAAIRTNLTESLKEGARTGSGGSSHARLRSALVVAEIATALVLLTVAGAFLRSFQKMREVDPGFRADHVLVAEYQLPFRQYPTNESVDNFNREVVDRLSREPGVVAAGMTNGLPASDAWVGAGYTIEGVPAADWKLKFAVLETVYGDYFQALKIPLLDGRIFTMDDRSNTIPVVIVNQTMAKDLWPGQRAIGKRMHAGNPKRPYPWATVIGVVADTTVAARDQPGNEQFYASAQQAPALYGATPSGSRTQASAGYITLRSTLPAEQMTQTLRSAVAGVDPLLPLQQVQPMGQVISNVEAPRRFNTVLIAAFAMGAILLAATGIYAVVAFTVSLRRQEIAIRMALGAQRVGIARLVLISATKLALLGCGFGLIASLAVSRVVSAFLFGVSATDPMVYLGAVAAMMLLALLASALPASRAASGDPIEALRSS